MQFNKKKIENYLHVVEDSSLDVHDNRYHEGHFDGKGHCSLREKYSQGDLFDGIDVQHSQETPHDVDNSGVLNIMPADQFRKVINDGVRRTGGGMVGDCRISQDGVHATCNFHYTDSKATFNARKQMLRAAFADNHFSVNGMWPGTQISISQRVLTGDLKKDLPKYDLQELSGLISKFDDGNHEYEIGLINQEVKKREPKTVEQIANASGGHA